MKQELMIEIKLLGNCQILVNNCDVCKEKTKLGKPWQLLCRFAFGLHEWISADILIEEFWPNKGYAKAYNCLKNTILILRDDLQTITGFNCDGFIKSMNGGYQLSQAVKIKADIADFKCIYQKILSKKQLDMPMDLVWFKELARVYKGGPVYQINQQHWISRYSKHINQLFYSTIERCFAELNRQGLYEELVLFYEELSLETRVSDEMTSRWHYALKKLDADEAIPTYEVAPSGAEIHPQTVFNRESKGKTLLSKIKKEISQTEKSPAYISEYSDLVRYCKGNLSRYALTLFSFEPIEPEQTNLEESIELFNHLASTALRGNDIIAHYSKDTVLVVLPNHSAGSSAIVRRRLCNLFAEKQKNVLVHGDITAVGVR